MSDESNPVEPGISTLYAVYSPSGELYAWTISICRQGAIRDYLCGDTDTTWQQEYDKGFRVRKVRITPVEE